MNVWRERMNLWLTPVARRVPLHPNTITAIALLLNLAAASALAFAWKDRRLFLAAVVLVGFAGILDALDGVTARVKNLTSTFGDFLDHFCDRVSDVSLFAGWLLGTHVRPLIGIPALLLIMLNGYLGTQLEATFGKRSYDTIGRGEFVLGLIALPIIAYSAVHSAHFPAIVEGMTILGGGAASIGIAQRFREAVRLAKDQ